MVSCKDSTENKWKNKQLWKTFGKPEELLQKTTKITRKSGSLEAKHVEMRGDSGLLHSTVLVFKY